MTFPFDFDLHRPQTIKRNPQRERGKNKKKEEREKPRKNRNEALTGEECIDINSPVNCRTDKGYCFMLCYIYIYIWKSRFG